MSETPGGSAGTARRVTPLPRDAANELQKAVRDSHEGPAAGRAVRGGRLRLPAPPPPAPQLAGGTRGRAPRRRGLRSARPPTPSTTQPSPIPRRAAAPRVAARHPAGCKVINSLSHAGPRSGGGCSCYRRWWAASPPPPPRRLQQQQRGMAAAPRRRLRFFLLLFLLLLLSAAAPLGAKVSGGGWARGGGAFPLSFLPSLPPSPPSGSRGQEGRSELAGRSWPVRACAGQG